MNFAMATSFLAWSVIVSYAVTCICASIGGEESRFAEGPFRVHRSGRSSLPQS